MSQGEKWNDMKWMIKTPVNYKDKPSVSTVREWLTLTMNYETMNKHMKIVKGTISCINYEDIKPCFNAI